MFRDSIRPLVFAYLLVGVVTTVVTEVIAGMQGSSSVIGAFTSGAPPEVLISAVFKDWLLPVVTWPMSIFGFALNQISAHG